MTRHLCANAKSSLRGRPAFTLIELVVTVLVMGILASAAVPRFADSLHYHRAESAAERVAADMRLVRQHSKSASKSLQMVFSGGTNSYTIAGLPHIDRATEDYSVVLSDWPYLGSLTSIKLSSGGNILSFNGYGIPDSDAEIQVESGGHARTVKLVAETNKVTIE